MEVVHTEAVGAAGRSEESLARSLAELRAIELQRQTEEQAAVEAAVQARRREREAAAQAARDAEAARLAAERAAERAAEQARADAEREARLQIEAIEAAERARRLIALEEHRIAAELAVQREAALRQRPRGLLALSMVALAAAAGLGWLAFDRAQAAATAVAARDHALAAIDRAERATGEARQSLAHTARELAALRAEFDAVRRAAPPAPAPHAADPHPAPARTPHGRPPAAPPTPQPVHLTEDCLRSPLCHAPAGMTRAPTASRRM
ncbi:MAG TPA: hypothetical protein VHW23_31835 [Kofleriaceae bacterium]|jgi:hypothetical protein|nr:hypothetical protein [Kofleriaceae bacterium]